LVEARARIPSQTPVNKVTRHNLICWYTNADTLTNKMAELRIRVRDANEKPHLILVTEVKPKNSRYQTTEAEIDIASYVLHTTELNSKNGSKGTCIYIQTTPFRQEKHR